MDTVFIATSMPGRARPDYFFALAESFAKCEYRVVMIIDGKPENLPLHEKILFFKWPSKRPTKLKDFIFLRKIILIYRPSIMISSFGSVNIMNVCGYFLKVKNRINYVLSVSEPFYEKVGYNKIVIRKILKERKKKIYQMATFLICNSMGTEKDSIDYYALHNKEILVLHNLIKQSSGSYRSFEERYYQIIIVGNLIKRKGHAFLLDQFKEALNFHPRLKLIIVGNGSEKKSLIEKVERLDILNKVEFVGEVSNTDITRYFSNSLISISASIHEAFGFVNIEAMREGTPLICTPTVGGLEILKSKSSGEFFTLENKTSLTKAINTILKNWEFYSKNSLKCFTELYALETQIDSHRKLLEKSII